MTWGSSQVMPHHGKKHDTVIHGCNILMFLDFILPFFNSTYLDTSLPTAAQTVSPRSLRFGCQNGWRKMYLGSQQGLWLAWEIGNCWAMQIIPYLQYRKFQYSSYFTIHLRSNFCIHTLATSCHSCKSAVHFLFGYILYVRVYELALANTHTQVLVIQTGQWKLDSMLPPEDQWLQITSPLEIRGADVYRSIPDFCQYADAPSMYGCMIYMIYV